MPKTDIKNYVILEHKQNKNFANKCLMDLENKITDRNFLVKLIIEGKIIYESKQQHTNFNVHLK